MPLPNKELDMNTKFSFFKMVFRLSLIALMLMHPTIAAYIVAGILLNYFLKRLMNIS